MRSLNENVRVLIAVAPQTTSGTGTPTSASVAVIDTQGYNTAQFALAVGTATGTTAAVTLTLDAQVYECATSNGTFTAVSGASIVQVTAVVSAAGKIAQIPVEGLGLNRLRYLKLVVTPSVTPTADAKLPIFAVCNLGRAYQSPVGNSLTAA